MKKRLMILLTVLLTCTLFAATPMLFTSPLFKGQMILEQGSSVIRIYYNGLEDCYSLDCKTWSNAVKIGSLISSRGIEKILQQYFKPVSPLDETFYYEPDKESFVLTYKHYVLKDNVKVPAFAL